MLKRLLITVRRTPLLVAFVGGFMLLAGDAAVVDAKRNNRDFLYYACVAAMWIGLALLIGFVVLALMKFVWPVDARPDLKRCSTCGYDLCASPERCPECGTAVKPPMDAGERR